MMLRRGYWDHKAGSLCEYCLFLLMCQDKKAACRWPRGCTAGSCHAQSGRCGRLCDGLHTVGTQCYSNLELSNNASIIFQSFWYLLHLDPAPRGEGGAFTQILAAAFQGGCCGLTKATTSSQAPEYPEKLLSALLPPSSPSTSCQLSVLG